MSDSSQDCLLSLWESIAEAKDRAEIPEILERAASRFFGVACELRILDREPPGLHSLEIVADDGSHLAWLNPLGPSQTTHLAYREVLLRMVGWAMQRGQLLHAARERRHMLNELNVGRKVLEESLPPPVLTTPHWQLAALLEPAQHLGGDLFAYSHGRGFVRFLLADAVGHGLGSTLLASECRALWRALADEPTLLCEAEKLSRMLHEDTGDSRFVAATLGRCLPDGMVEYVACGQGPSFFSHGGVVSVLEETDPPLGLFEEQRFTLQRCLLDPGDSLICTSDGLLEWENEARQMFGVEGVTTCLESRTDLGAEQLAHQLFEAVKQFYSPPSARDDTCVLVVQRRALSNAPRVERSPRAWAGKPRE